MGWVFGRGFDSRQVHFFKKMGYKGECEKTAWLTRFSHFFILSLFYNFLHYFSALSTDNSPYFTFSKICRTTMFSLSTFISAPNILFIHLSYHTLDFLFYKIPRPSNNIFTPIIIKIIPPANSAPER